jgi:seryl-tRNA synthetase
MKAAHGKPDAKLIARGRAIKDELSDLEENLRGRETELNDLLRQVPNIIFDDVPEGGEDDSVEIRTWGDKRDDAKIDHLDYMEQRDWVDFARGAKVAGNKFYFLKNAAVLLEQAVINYAQNKLIEQGFTLMTTPDLVNVEIAAGAGFAPKSDKESNEYFVEGTDLTLIGTAEAPLTGYHADEIFEADQLPLLYAGFSACFRREAGAAGKHARGLFRVHQFNKLEMYAFCLPEQSRDLHEKLLSIEEAIWQDLGIPYHVVNIAAGDLGAPAAKKFDIEYWSPIDAKYRELTSCSNCTDFQATALNIRVRRAGGTLEFVHTLNGTAVSLARTLVALMENYAQTDGTFKVPEKLQPYLGGKTTL